MSKHTEAIRMLREMTEDELGEHLSQQRRRLFELRFQQATGQVENHRQIRDVRREIARTLTLRVELERGIVNLAPQPKPAPVVAEAKPRRRREKKVEETSLAEAEPQVEEVDPDE
jgi:large subunit ribosomal protein L29